MTDTAVEIRPAVRADAAAIATIYIQSAEHHQRLDPERYFVPEFAAIETRYREGGRHAATTLVAVRENEILGFVDARLDRSLDAMHRDILYCHIAEIAVSATDRSKGIGEQLLRAAEQWGREHGAEVAYLEYVASNTRAAAFYHDRMGYKLSSAIATKRL